MTVEEELEKMNKLLENLTSLLNRLISMEVGKVEKKEEKRMWYIE
jgi:hypothetical protein